MSERFFDRPILNSPYEYPARHWELDESGQPTGRTRGPATPRIVHHAHSVRFKPKKRSQYEMGFDEDAQALGSFERTGQRREA